MTPNFNSKQIISKEELTAWDESLRELLGNILYYNRSSVEVGGIIDSYDYVNSAYINDFFHISVGSVPSGGFNTLKIGIGKGVLGIKNTTTEEISGLVTNNDSLKNTLLALFKWAETDNIVIDGISGYTSGNVIYFGFIPVWNPLEAGLCNITSTNQVTISGGDFDKVRGQSTKNPTKVRFYQENGSPASNDDIYEVVSVDHNTNTLIISGAVNTEGNLKMLIVGSYDLSAQGSLTDVFAYVKAEGSLTFSATATDITGVGGFIVGSLTFGSAGAFIINDLRLNNFFDLQSTDTLYKSRIQEITGQKTFSTASPIFNVPVIDQLNVSFTTPLSLPATGLTTTLTIPATGGNVFQIRSYSSDIDHRNTLRYIEFADGYVAGTRFYLYVYPAGSPLTIESTIVEHGIAVYDKNGTLTGTIIPPGTLLELWADSAGNWRLCNRVAEEVSGWVTVDSIYMGGGLISNSSNVVQYKNIGNQVLLYINSLEIQTTPVTFTLPFTFSQAIQDKLFHTLGDVIFSINTSGLVTIPTVTRTASYNKLTVIPL